ncbi:MAG: PfkB family carbohydrate kinase [bacterium]
MKRIIAIGATTYDIIFKNNKPVEARIGGSQLNTAVSLSRLGLPVTFISRIGNDRIGDISLEELKDNKVETTFISRFNDHSRVAFAFLDEFNNAEYSFFKPSVKMPKIRFPGINPGDIILFGSSYALIDDVHAQLIPFLLEARKKNAVILYDPNIRKSHMDRYHQVKPILMENFKQATIIKGSDEDFTRLFGSNNSLEAYEELKKINPSFDFVYTANKNNLHVHTSNFSGEYPVPKINPLSTIGAGDNINAGIIYSIFSNKGILKSKKDWDFLVNTSILFAQHVCLQYDNYLDKDWCLNFIKNRGVKKINKTN